MIKGSFTCIYCGKSHFRFLEKCPETGEKFSPVHKFEGALLDGRYRLNSILGEGGMGVVYEGLHEKLGNKVAVKFLRQDLKFSKETLKRFETEAQVAASLGHKNIVRIFDIGSYESIPYFVMEFLDGKPLDEILNKKGILPINEAADITIQILEGLKAVHSKGIIHRDLKPENIMVTPQHGGGEIVKILDFGICRLQSDAAQQIHLTKTGTIFGTPYYMSPEQAEGRKDIDSRTDLYSVGAILYKMLTGKTPFTGENYNAVIINIINKEPLPVREQNREIPWDLGEVIMKAISKNPAERFIDAGEFIKALEPFSSTPVRREFHSSALSRSDEKREPISAAELMEESSVEVSVEEYLPTLPIQKISTQEISAEMSLPENKLASVPAERHVLPPGKRLLSWDTIKKIPQKKAEIIWLMPAGIAASIVATIIIAWSIITILFDRKLLIALSTLHLATSFSISNFEKSVNSKVKDERLVTNIEESVLNRVDKKLFLLTLVGIPSNARVFINGNETFENPVPLEPMQKPYLIEITAPNFAPFSQEIQMRQDMVLQVNLKPKTIKKGSFQPQPLLPTIDTKYPGKKQEKKKRSK